MPGLTAFNALIRTHHITSRKKIANLRSAATANAVLVILRTGGSPGIMYVEGAQAGVEAWVNTVQKLRYKDYQVVGRITPVTRHDMERCDLSIHSEGVHELDTVKQFALAMQQRGVFAWWRSAMGYPD